MVKRIYHTWDKWECYPAGLYENKPPRGMTADQCRAEYAALLRDDDQFRSALRTVLQDWPNSCEHYLSNERMNRIAWLGQAAMCAAKGVSRQFRGGFNRLTAEDQERANSVALEALNEWLTSRGEDPLTAEAAASKTEMDLY